MNKPDNIYVTVFLKINCIVNGRRTLETKVAGPDKKRKTTGLVVFHWKLNFPTVFQKDGQFS